LPLARALRGVSPALAEPSPDLAADCRLGAEQARLFAESGIHSGERRVRPSGYPGAAPARGDARAKARGRSGAREVRHVTERGRVARRTGASA
ncbi:hypothetical protein AB8850_33235, partial [Streptomyces griseorubens]